MGDISKIRDSQLYTSLIKAKMVITELNFVFSLHLKGEGKGQ